MDILSELGDFSGVCRLFPLPNVVLFPHVVLPLHIFEPRYRQMTRDALDGDQLITMVQSRPIASGPPCVEPVPIYTVGCVGRIIQHEPLPDGRFNLLLLGCKRVRLVCEMASPKLYRIAQGSVIEDVEPASSDDERREELIRIFLEVLQSQHALDPELTQLLRSDLSMGILSDIMAHALELPGSVKQDLLDESRVVERVSGLLTLLRGLHEPSPRSRRFPHPFSLN